MSPARRLTAIAALVVTLTIPSLAAAIGTSASSPGRGALSHRPIAGHLTALRQSRGSTIATGACEPGARNQGRHCRRTLASRFDGSDRKTSPSLPWGKRIDPKHGRGPNEHALAEVARAARSLALRSPRASFLTVEGAASLGAQPRGRRARLERRHLRLAHDSGTPPPPRGPPLA